MTPRLLRGYLPERIAATPRLPRGKYSAGRVAAAGPYVARSRRFWRGTIGQLTGGKGDRSTGDYIHDLNHGMGCRHESGNYARLQGCGLTNAYPKQFDVKWVRHCTPRPIKSLRNDNCRDVLPRKSYPVTCAGLPSGHYASHTTYVQYFCRADLPSTNRGDAAAATWIFRGEKSRATGICRSIRWS